MIFQKKRRLNQIDPEKKALYRKLYLSGKTLEHIALIASDLEPEEGVVVSESKVYYHLQPLSPNDKARHTKRMAEEKRYLFHSAQDRRDRRERLEQFDIICFLLALGALMLGALFL